MAQPQRDHIKAGLFVLIGIVLALAVVFVLADFKRFMQPKQTVQVLYQLSDGVQGLKAGAPVTLGDQPIGEVQAILPYQNADSQVIGMNVSVVIPSKILLFWNAQIELVVPPLGSGTRLNIASVGNEVPYSTDSSLPARYVPMWAIPANINAADLTEAQRLTLYLGPRNAIPGTLAGSPLVRDMAVNFGIESRQRQEIQQIIQNIVAITTTVKEDLPKLTSQSKNILTRAEKSFAKLDESLENVRTITEEVRIKTDQWTDNIDTTLAKTKHLVSEIDDLITQKKQIVMDFLDNAKAMSGDLQALASNLKTKTFDQVTDALDKAQAALENVRVASQKVRDFATGQKPILERTIANAQIAGEQLKLATIEIRRSPWRLLHSPSENELETDNLYDAARSFAMAAGTLDAVSRSLESIASQSEIDPEQVNEMVEHLASIFAKFKQTENTFWEALGKYKPAP